MNTQPHVLQPAFVLTDFVSLRFLPSLFGHDYAQAENNVYLYASRYLANYDGTVRCRVVAGT